MDWFWIILDLLLVFLDLFGWIWWRGVEKINFLGWWISGKFVEIVCGDDDFVVVEDEEEHEGKDEEEQKDLVLMVHRYIQWSCNLMTETISKILDIK